MAKRIVALGYQAESGKDTVAEILMDHDVLLSRFALAQPMKASARTLFGLTAEQTDGKLKNVIDPRWGCTPRALMQKLASALRSAFGEDIQVRMMLDRAHRWKEDYIVVPDVRVRAEADALRAAGAKLVKVDRPGERLSGTEAAHHTEHELASYEWDAVIVNDGTIEQLKPMARNTYNRLFSEEK